MNATLQCLFLLPAFAPTSGPFGAAYAALVNERAGGSVQQPVDMRAFVSAISSGWNPMAGRREKKNMFNGRSHQVLALLHSVACKLHHAAVPAALQRLSL